MGRVISVGVWLMDLGLDSMLLIIMYTMISIRLLLMMLGGRLCLYNLGLVGRRIYHIHIDNHPIPNNIKI